MEACYGSPKKLRRERGREGRTCDTDTVNVVGDDTCGLDDVIELGASTMEDNGVKADAVEEAEVESKLIYLVEDGTADLDDGEFCGVGGI